MKMCNPIITLVVVTLIFTSSACTGKSTQATPVQRVEIANTETPEVLSETLESSSTPKIEYENAASPYPISTITDNIPTSTSSPEPSPNPLENTPDPGISQNPYPLPLSDAPVSGNLSGPYPQPLINTPITVVGQDPYPQPMVNPPVAGNVQDPYPAPGGNVSPNATQPIAINPIQTPVATVDITVNETISATGTTIVRTKLSASDPATVTLISGKTQLIEIFAFWCPYSRSMAPVMNGLEGKYQGRITFIYLDIDDPANKPFKEALGYKYQPHFFLLDGEGKLLHQWRGFTPVEDFEAVLTPLFP